MSEDPILDAPTGVILADIDSNVVTQRDFSTKKPSYDAQDRVVRKEGDEVQGQLNRYQVMRMFDHSMNPTYLVQVMGSTQMAVLKDPLPDTPGFRTYANEHSVLQVVRHPCLVELIDGHTSGDTPFMVLKFVPGDDLLIKLRNERRLHPPEALRVLASVSDALHSLHEVDIIHRDVKPGNIIVKPDGSGFVIDVGLARYRSEFDFQEGVIIGTPSYISPEQAAGLRADARSDVYSLGLVLVETLTGRKAFQAATNQQVLLRQIKMPVTPPRMIHPCIPPEVAAVALRAAQKMPENRYPSAQAFKEALYDAVEKTKGSYECACQ